MSAKRLLLSWLFQTGNITPLKRGKLQANLYMQLNIFIIHSETPVRAYHAYVWHIVTE